MFAIHAVHGVDRESKVKVCGNVFTIANAKVVGGDQTEYWTIRKFSFSFTASE